MIDPLTTWTALGAMAAIAAVVGASATTVIRAALTRDFVRRTEIEPIEDAIETLQTRLNGMPERGDLARIEMRLSAVEAQCAATTASVDALATALGRQVGRVEHMVDLLYQQQLNGVRGELS